MTLKNYSLKHGLLNERVKSETEETPFKSTVASTVTVSSAKSKSES